MTDKDRVRPEETLQSQERRRFFEVDGKFGVTTAIEPAEEGVDSAADERDRGPDADHDRVVQDGLAHDRESRSGHDGQRQRPENGPIDAVVRQSILVVRHDLNETLPRAAHVIPRTVDNDP